MITVKASPEKIAQFNEQMEGYKTILHTENVHVRFGNPPTFDEHEIRFIKKQLTALKWFFAVIKKSNK